MKIGIENFFWSLFMKTAFENTGSIISARKIIFIENLKCNLPWGKTLFFFYRNRETIILQEFKKSLRNRPKFLRNTLFYDYYKNNRVRVSKCLESITQEFQKLTKNLPYSIYVF